jgi:hypothetical protein
MTGRKTVPSFSSIDSVLKILERFDITEAFKTKGDLKRWSAKRTIGGVIAITACNDIITNGMSWQAVVLCGISVVPLCLSFWDKSL